MKTILSNPNSKYFLIGIFVLINIIALYKFGIDPLIDYYWHLMISTGGGILWGWLWFMIEKNISDDSNGNFDYSTYTKKHWEEWVFTFMLSFVVVGYLPEIIIAVSPYLAVGDGINNLYYFIPGPLSLMLIYGAVGLKKKFKP
jgi:hypothetical protein